MTWDEMMALSKKLTVEERVLLRDTLLYDILFDKINDWAEDHEEELGEDDIVELCDLIGYDIDHDMFESLVIRALHRLDTGWEPPEEED